QLEEVALDVGEPALVPAVRALDDPEGPGPAARLPERVPRPLRDEAVGVAHELPEDRVVVIPHRRRRRVVAELLEDTFLDGVLGNHLVDDPPLHRRFPRVPRLPAELEVREAGRGRRELTQLRLPRLRYVAFHQPT